MTIISCIKQVRDLDIVLKGDWVVASDGVSIDIDYANRIMNTFDETSLELMLRLRDEHHMKTKVVTLGDCQSEAVLRKAMAVGVDEATRIENSGNLEFSPEQVAIHLKSYIQKELNDHADVNLIMCGRQADNGSHGQTGQLLAEMLGWPCITMVTDIRRVHDGYRISRLINDGIEHVSVNAPVIVTVTQSDNKLLRMATLKNMIEAKKKTIQVFGVEQDYEKSPYKLEKLRVSKPTKHCVFLEDTTDHSKTSQLVQILKLQMDNEVF